MKTLGYISKILVGVTLIVAGTALTLSGFGVIPATFDTFKLPIGLGLFSLGGLLFESAERYLKD